MAVDTSFIRTQHQWNFNDLQNLQYSFPLSLPAYFSLNPLLGTAHAFLFEPGTAGQLSYDANSAILDQQDIVRYLLDDPAQLLSYAGDEKVNARLAATANTSVNGNTVNYRVSYADVISAHFSESDEGHGELAIMNQQAYDAADPSKTYLPTDINQLMGSAGG